MKKRHDLLELGVLVATVLIVMAGCGPV